MTNSSCETTAQDSTISTIIAVTNGFSVLICLLAAIFVCFLDLYTKVVYRLAVYQVLSSLLFALVCVGQVVFANRDKAVDGDELGGGFYSRLCIAFGWFMVYTQWMKLLFTMWVTLHLFCFAVLHKNLKKLEPLYVATSLLIPALIAAVPLTTNTYHLTPLTTCWIDDAPNMTTGGMGNVETFALWYGPAMVILLAASATMVVMVIKLACTVCWRLSYEPLSEGDQFWNALKQLLPLAAFPILFCFFIMPPFVLHIYQAMETVSCPLGLYILSSVCFSLWSMTSGITLIVHISVTKGRKKGAAIHSAEVDNAAA